MVAVSLVPAGVWMHPTNDAIYMNFDPSLIYASPTSKSAPSVVRLSTDTIEMSASPSSTPTVNLVTTPLRKFRTELDVVIMDNSAAVQPFRLGVWAPWEGSGYFVAFGPPPQNLITADALTNGAAGNTLVSGEIVNRVVLGRYELGHTYRVDIDVDKDTGTIASRVQGASENASETSINSTLLPSIFRSVQLSLTASVAPGPGLSRIVLRNYTLTLPHERFWADKTSDPRAEALLISLESLGVIATLVAVVVWIRRIGSATQAAIRRKELADARPRLRITRSLSLLAGGIFVYIVGNALLFQFGGHPFDMGNQKLYAYVARMYGPAQLYYLPNLVSLADIWGGVPKIESAFPYEPVTAYLSTATGWLASALFAGGGSINPRAVQIEYLIKAVNVLFGLADSVLIYQILRDLRISFRWCVLGGALFLFNPAVWFAMSIWGQTHVVTLFLVLAAILLAFRRLPTWAWLALVAACLTRPQMLVFGLLMGVAFLRVFSWQQNVTAMSWAVILSFIALSPFTLATSPSLPVDIMLHNFLVQEGGGNQLQLTTVSQGAYSIWPLVTYVTHGDSGLQRSFTPSSTLLVGWLTYQRLSQLLTLSSLLLVSGFLAFRKQEARGSAGYVPLVALGIASFLMLQTGLVATHFVLALPLLILCRPWISTAGYFFLVSIWTITTFVPMYGDMAVATSNLHYPLLAAPNNAVTRFIVGIYGWDRFMTAAIVGNICAVVWLGVSALRHVTRERAALTPL